MIRYEGLVQGCVQTTLDLIAFHLTTRTNSSQGAYYHELFLRSKRFLCRRIKRTLNKTSGPNALDEEDVPAPDFYAMPSLPEEDGAGAASSADNEGLFRKPPKSQGGLKTPPGSLGKNADAGWHGGHASPAALVASLSRSDAPSRVVSSATLPFSEPQNLPSLIQRDIVPSAPSLAAAATANVGEHAGLSPTSTSLYPRGLLDRHALLRQHVNTAVTALLTSQAQTLALHQLASSLTAFPSSGLPNMAQPHVEDHQTLSRISSSRLSMSRNDYQHQLTPHLSRPLPLSPLQAFLRQQQRVRQLQLQPQRPPQPQLQLQLHQRWEESKSADLAALTDVYMRRYNESKDSS